jgi:tetratricopeptide (TPR) repeat protein
MSLVILLFIAGSTITANVPIQSSDTTAWLRDLIDRGSLDTAWVIAEHYAENHGEGRDIAAVKALYLKGEVLHAQFEYPAAIPLFEQSIALLGNQDVNLEFDIRGLLVDSYKYTGSLDLADEQNEYMLRNIDAVDTRRKAQVHFRAFSLAHIRLENDRALTHALKSLKLMEETGEFSMAATMRSEIGVIYHQLDEDSLASIFHQEALDYFNTHDELINASFVYMERGSMHIDLGNFQEAELDFKSALEIAEQEDHLGNIANTKSLLGALYNKMGRYLEARNSFQASLDLCREYDIPIGIATCLDGLADVNHKLGNLDLALEQAKEQYELSKAHGFTDMEPGALAMLSEIYASRGEYMQAYQMKAEADQLRDSLFTLEKTKAIGELREKYEREKNLRAIATLESQAEIDQVKRRGLLGGLILTLLLGGLIINREIKRRKKAKQLHETEKRLAETEHQRLKEQLDHKNRELTSNALNMARKSEFLTVLNEQLTRLNSSMDLNKDVRGLKNQLRIEGQMEENWDQFTAQFTETNPQFYENLRESYPDLSKGELRMAALLRMNLGNKDIARILSISDDGVKKARYRLRKKLALQSEQSLEAYVMAL